MRPDLTATATLAITLGWALALSALAQTASGQATQAQSPATGLPQAAATTALPELAATALPSPAATTDLPDPAATTDLPDPAATTALPEPAATAALPEPAATAAPPTEGFFAPSTIVTETVVPGGDVLAPDMGAVDSSPGETGSSASAALDRSLLDAVVAALSADAALRGTSLNVTVSDGLVRITGTAATSEQAARVHDVATRVAGAGRVSAAITTPG